MQARRILETCLYVNDLDEAREFYAGAMGLEVVEEQAGRHLFLRCGAQMLLLFLPEASRQTGGVFPPHGTTGAGHVAFAATDAELETWRAVLTGRGITIETDFAWPQGGRSVYFRDPAGNSLEFATPRIWGLDDLHPR
jgi:catechol 2,3-dioxygenase-like lactoylglutathione lyase family enzyme